MDGVGISGFPFASLTVPMGSVAVVMVCCVVRLSAQSLVVSPGPMGQQTDWVWVCLPVPVGSRILLGCGDLLVGPYGLRVLYCKIWVGPMGSGVIWIFLDSPVPMGSGIVCVPLGCL